VTACHSNKVNAKLGCSLLFVNQIVFVAIIVWAVHVYSG